MGQGLPHPTWGLSSLMETNSQFSSNQLISNEDLPGQTFQHCATRFHSLIERMLNSIIAVPLWRPSSTRAAKAVWTESSSDFIDIRRNYRQQRIRRRGNIAR